MRIGGFDLSERVLIVAEIGNNHEGDVRAARAMVEAAAGAGADAVKFQTFRTELFVNPAEKARFEQLARFELTPDVFVELQELAHALGLLFLSTPLDLPSAAFLEPLVDAFKIASADLTFVPLLDRVAQGGKPVILSSGLSDLELIRAAVARVREGESVAVLHAVTAYPTDPADVNLAAIGLLADELGVPIGYSDHTLGIEVSVLAVAAGARIVEKHFTLDKSYSSFRDHALSADPEELAVLVQRIRGAESTLGQRTKRVLDAERELEPAVRRSIVAAAALPAGHIVELADLAWTRPSGGLPPGEEERLLGRRLRRSLGAGERISAGDVD